MVFILILVFGLSGCVNSNPILNKNHINVVAETKKYLENKYNCEFTYISPYGATMGSNGSSFIFKCSDFPDKDILVDCIFEEDGTMNIYDNYVAVKYEDDVYNKLKNIVNDVFDNSKIFYDTSKLSLPKKLNGQSSLEEYLQNNNNSVESVFIVNISDDFKEKEDKLISMLKKEKINIAVKMYFVNDLSSTEVNETNYPQLSASKDWYLHKVNFFISPDMETIYENWD